MPLTALIVVYVAAVVVINVGVAVIIAVVLDVIIGRVVVIVFDVVLTVIIDVMLFVMSLIDCTTRSYAKCVSLGCCTFGSTATNGDEVMTIIIDNVVAIRID